MTFNISVVRVGCGAGSSVALASHFVVVLPVNVKHNGIYIYMCSYEDNITACLLEQIKGNCRHVAGAKWEARFGNAAWNTAWCVVDVICQTGKCNIRPWGAYHKVWYFGEISLLGVTHPVQACTMSHSMFNATSFYVCRRENHVLFIFLRVISEFVRVCFVEIQRATDEWRDNDGSRYVPNKVYLFVLFWLNWRVNGLIISGDLLSTI